MIGMSFEGLNYLCGDNQSVLANTSNAESTSKKNSMSLACYPIREVVNMDDWRKFYVNANDNEADLLSKVLLFG